jgi:hypothetical protein
LNCGFRVGGSARIGVRSILDLNRCKQKPETSDFRYVGQISNRKNKLSCEIHPASLTIDELLTNCSIKRTRGSGPGGQHRNKVETAIVITHDPTGIVGQATEKRSQLKNRNTAIERLRVNLALAIRVDFDAAQGPGELWKSRIKSKKIQVNPSHPDFPALLAEALDAIVALDFDVARSAVILGVTTSQLVKFLKTCPSSLEFVNREREKRNASRLN